MDGGQPNAIIQIIKKPYAWGPVLAIMLAIGGWILFGPKPGDDLSDGQKALLTMHVAGVRGNLAQNLLDEALANYDLAKALSPGHPDVVQAGTEIGARYFLRAGTAVAAGTAGGISGGIATDTKRNLLIAFNRFTARIGEMSDHGIDVRRQPIVLGKGGHRWHCDCSDDGDQRDRND